ncbi:MAG TPA: hypothetical protein VLJ57_02490 [Burkholderiaceae bacterium]|nr:hypothetical protein [Burkholderiaceae bacterium]
MATPNYGYEKRQRELAKKQKKQEKLKSKAERKVGDHHEDDAPPDHDAAQTPGQAPGTAGQP